MLTALFGNQSVERILLFLLVNEKCYASQVSRLLHAPLTPIQKALARLEKGGILTSSYEGKTRVYTYDRTYPLLDDLEGLLKKAYSLLSPQEKKRYAFVRFATRGKPHEGVVIEVWERLAGISSVSFAAKSHLQSESGWNGRGRGDVRISTPSKNVLVFEERGSWSKPKGEKFTFSNVFRWTLDPAAKVIALEHLRFGVDKPVFLFHLVPAGEDALESGDSHLCGGDTYLGRIVCDPHYLRLNWRILGPRKNEELDYLYT